MLTLASSPAELLSTTRASQEQTSVTIDIEDIVGTAGMPDAVKSRFDMPSQQNPLSVQHRQALIRKA